MEQRMPKLLDIPLLIRGTPPILQHFLLHFPKSFDLHRQSYGPWRRHQTRQSAFSTSWFATIVTRSGSLR